MAIGDGERKFGISRFGMGIEEARQKEYEKSQLETKASQISQLDRSARRAFRDLTRKGDKEGAFDLMLRATKSGVDASGGIRQSGFLQRDVENRHNAIKANVNGLNKNNPSAQSGPVSATVSSSSSRNNGPLQTAIDRRDLSTATSPEPGVASSNQLASNDSIEAFAGDLSRSNLIAAGDKNATNRALLRGKNLGMGKDEILGLAYSQFNPNQGPTRPGINENVGNDRLSGFDSDERSAISNLSMLGKAKTDMSYQKSEPLDISAFKEGILSSITPEDREKNRFMSNFNEAASPRGFALQSELSKIDRQAQKGLDDVASYNFDRAKAEESRYDKNSDYLLRAIGLSNDTTNRTAATRETPQTNFNADPGPFYRPDPLRDSNNQRASAIMNELLGRARENAPKDEKTKKLALQDLKAGKEIAPDDLFSRMFFGTGRTSGTSPRSRGLGY